MLKLCRTTSAALLLTAGLLACEEGPPPVAPEGAPGVGAAFAPPEAHVQRLTQSQYAAAVRQLLGPDVLVPQALEPDVSLDGFIAVGASRSSISARGVEQYEAAAFDLAEQALTDPTIRARLVDCDAGAQCARETLARLARVAWRRPASPEELDRLAALHTQAEAALSDFHLALQYPLAAILQSPHFLWRGELGEPDPDAPGERRYTSIEMASRLSFFLWNAPPDEALMAAAEAGDLVDDAKLRAQVLRMLVDPRARTGLRNFVTEHLDLHALDQMVKDPTVFVHASPELGDSAREETLAGFEHLVFDLDGDFRDLMTTRRTFVDRRLAALYGVPAPQGEGFALTWLPEDGPRRGLLGQASVLALNAHAESSSATLRGKFVRTSLLCDELPPPPANVDTSIPEPTPDAPTLRDRVKVHLENEACSSCHRAMDPLGLALENFDGIGRYRATEGGAVIDSSGDLDGVAFDDATGLAWTLREDPRLGECLTRKLYRYATGVVEERSDEVLIDALAERFADDGYRVKALLLDIALSPGFRRAREASE